ncbi:MAG: HU family DNA-binding protein [Clostridia bacterium]|nr:HU family DNA-binding protein [Clostridia bacterium]
MNKNDLIASVAEQAKLSRKDSERAVNAVVDTIQKALARGDKVSLVGFGTFEVRQRRARTGRNPQTGEPVRIPATRVPSFKAGKGLKEAIGK